MASIVTETCLSNNSTSSKNYENHYPEHTGILDFNETEIKLILAGGLYERGKLSLGQVADLACLTKRGFIEIMEKYGFFIFSQSTDDLISDIENA